MTDFSNDNPYRSPQHTDRAERTVTPLPGERVVHGIHELTADVSDSPYYNADVAPTKLSDRKWGTRDIAALWVGMCACIPSYQLASGLIKEGMNWSEAIITVTLGNLIVLVPMILNAHVGTKYGIPFPVYCRVSFGIRGANVAALLRAFVACGWFGIQTWIGGVGLYIPLVLFFPALKETPELWDGITVTQMVCFMAFWALNIWIIFRGIESIRLFINLATPILILVPLALLFWAWDQAGGTGPIFNQPSQFADGQPKAGQFWAYFIPALTGMVGFWSTLALNIPDFTRYAVSQRAQVVGQALGLPTTMGLYAFIGVFVTSATVVIYGEAIWDPNELLQKFDNKFVVLIALIALASATLSTNIAANVVGPANDFANLAPKYVSFKLGGLITGIIGILMQPWKLMADPSGYIFTWLIAYSALLGAIAGILIADYYLVRNRVIVLPELYRRNGRYWYSEGFHPPALIALLCGVLPCLPGFLAQIQVINLAVDSFWRQLYHYAWFISFAIAAVTYLVLVRVTGSVATNSRNTP